MTLLSKYTGIFTGGVINSLKWLIGGAYFIAFNLIGIGSMLGGIGSIFGASGLIGVGATITGAGTFAAGTTTGILAGIGMSLPPLAIAIAATLALPAIVGGLSEAYERLIESTVNAKGWKKIPTIFAGIIASPINFISGFIKTTSNMWKGEGWYSSVAATQLELQGEFAGEHDSTLGALLPLYLKRKLDRAVVGPVFGLISGFVGGIKQGVNRIKQDYKSGDILGLFINSIFGLTIRTIKGTLQGIWRGMIGGKGPGYDTHKHLNSRSPSKTAVGIFSNNNSKYVKKRKKKLKKNLNLQSTELGGSVSCIMTKLKPLQHRLYWKSDELKREINKFDAGKSRISKDSRDELENAYLMAKKQEAIRKRLNPLIVECDDDPSTSDSSRSSFEELDQWSNHEEFKGSNHHPKMD